MTFADISNYFNSTWGAFLEPITILSKSSMGKSLVINSKQLYNFDEICKSIFQNKNVPTSTDGLTINKNHIVLVEFKSGFNQKITKENFDPNKARCLDANKICHEYWDLFFELQEKKRSELMSSIRDKAIESYITLEKHIFPLFPDISIPLKLIVVIDADPVDSIEDTLSSLCSPLSTSPKDNVYGSVRNALKRLIRKKDSLGFPYYYEEILVYSPEDFSFTLN